VIRVLIVEDDYRVAKLHAEFVAGVPDFEVVGLAHTASAALETAAGQRPDLVLLDLYLPDANGLEVLRRLRAGPEAPDAIVLTAAREMAAVRAAMRGGALHYLIKPFDYEALRERLTAYAELHARRSTNRETHQQEVDRLFGLMRRGAGGAGLALPKGQSPTTAALILSELGDADGPLAASEVAERVGVSRSTAQRYLASLADAGRVRLKLRYGATGRPEHRYELETDPVAPSGTP
jgi:response regulator of citrate/malate metabolism